MVALEKNAVLTLGFFDSLHLGHQMLISRAQSLAKENNADCIVCTFGDEFLHYINKTGEQSVFLLSERLEILKSMQIEKVSIFESSERFLNYTKREFLDYLNSFSPKAIVVGSDYRYGKGAEGDVAFLTGYFRERGVSVEVCEILTENGKKIATSDIRAFLRVGDILRANALLGRRFFIDGIVVEGRGEGRKFTVPTVNIDSLPQKLIPRAGVYKTYTVLDGERHLSVSSVGTHPTFFDLRENIETYIIGYAGNLYGKQIRVEFEQFLRDIIIFDDMDTLRNQISRDIKRVTEDK